MNLLEKLVEGCKERNIGSDFKIRDKKTYTGLMVNGYDVGAMFHKGDRKDLFSVGASPGSKFERLLELKVGKVVPSDTGKFSVAWLNLRKKEDRKILIGIIANVEKFKNLGLRKLYERHEEII